MRLTLLVLVLVGAGHCRGHELLLVAGSLVAEGLRGLGLDCRFGCLPFRLFRYSISLETMLK